MRIAHHRRPWRAPRLGAALRASVALLLCACGVFGAGCGQREEGTAGTAGQSSAPGGFLWGTATAAHQVEGFNTSNDWYLWEMIPGKIRNGDVSGIAVDHYHRFDEDFALAAQMGHNAYRFSIEWSRIEPARGHYDEEAIEHYHAVLDSLERHRLRPVVTLHHFTHPQWVLNPLRPDKDLDGWSSDETVEAFVRFAAAMAKEFGRQVDYWVTINEPLVLVNYQYFQGGFPSNRGPLSLEEGRRAIFQLLKAHAAAYHAIHEADVWDADGDGVSCLVSAAKHIRIMMPKDPGNPLDREGARQVDYVFNQVFFDTLIDGFVDSDLDGRYDTPGADPAEGYHAEMARTLDYIALNYYSRDVVTGVPFLPYLHGIPEENPDPAVEHNEMGWEIYPRGLYEVLTRFGRYGLPVIVTENGIPDAEDRLRPRFLIEHIEAMFEAMDEGIDVRGYLHWSLMDNFEWQDGFWPRFGLLAVEYPSLERTPRPSAFLYADIIRSGRTGPRVRGLPALGPRER